MIDPILAARLEALEQDLNHVGTPSRWAPKLQIHIAVGEGVWRRLDRMIGNRVKDQLTDLTTIRTSLERAEGLPLATEQERAARDELVRHAWRDYARVYHDSREIFGECLELIGGFAVRDTGIDEEICEVADELIRRCVQDTGEEWTPLTLPAQQEALAKTVGRILRLRFPEWTIWTLPFAAHEYGHVVIEDTEKDANRLGPFVEAEAERWARAAVADAPPAEEPQAAEQAFERARQRARHHLSVFVADAFATFTMGPAYACAAILLRLNPTAAGDERHPADARRARVVLAMLKAMNQDASAASGGIIKNPYGELIEQLERHWDSALQRVGLAVPADEDERLQQLVQRGQGMAGDSIRSLLFSQLLGSAEYPSATSSTGWQVAREWARQWSQQLATDQPEPSIKLPAEEAQRDAALRDAALRDVLNAAWQCRMLNPAPTEIRRIARGAHRLCQLITRAQRAPLSQEVPASSSRTPSWSSQNQSLPGPEARKVRDGFN